MVRGWSIALGVGLILLWISGLSSTAPGWLTWLDGLGGLAAFGIAGMTYPSADRATRAGLPIAISIGLYVLWVAALATGTVAWMAWWNFAFACAFLLLGIAAGANRPVSMERPSGLTREQDRKRSA